MTAPGLRGLGFKPNDLGINSVRPFVHVFNLAERGFKSYPAHGDTASMGMKDAASNDIDDLCEAYRIGGECDWRVVCGRDHGLYVVDFPRDCDQVWAEKEYGVLPATWMVTRPNGGTMFWFRARSGYPDLKLGVPLLGSRAELKSSAPVPGSIHCRSRERYVWVPGHAPGQCDLAALPMRWLVDLPKVGITARPILRPEWHDRSGHAPARWQ